MWYYFYSMCIYYADTSQTDANLLDCWCWKGTLALRVIMANITFGISWSWVDTNIDPYSFLFDTHIVKHFINKFTTERRNCIDWKTSPFLFSSWRNTFIYLVLLSVQFLCIPIYTRIACINIYISCNLVGILEMTLTILMKLCI